MGGCARWLGRAAGGRRITRGRRSAQHMRGRCGAGCDRAHALERRSDPAGAPLDVHGRHHRLGRLHDGNRVHHIGGAHRARSRGRRLPLVLGASLEPDDRQPHADGPRLLGARDPALVHRGRRAQLLCRRAWAEHNRGLSGLQPDGHLRRVRLRHPRRRVTPHQGAPRLLCDRLVLRAGVRLARRHPDHSHAQRGGCHRGRHHARRLLRPGGTCLPRRHSGVLLRQAAAQGRGGGAWSLSRARGVP